MLPHYILQPRWTVDRVFLVQGTATVNVTVNTSFSTEDIKRLQEAARSGFGPFIQSQRQGFDTAVASSGTTSTSIVITGDLVGPHLLGVEVKPWQGVEFLP